MTGADYVQQGMEKFMVWARDQQDIPRLSVQLAQIDVLYDAFDKEKGITNSASIRAKLRETVKKTMRGMR